MTATPRALLQSIAGPDPGAADGEFLRRYAETGDETAFAELVRRNGPLVLRACRNALRNPADADDAFQVTFLLLARNAGRLTGSPSLAGWLHTVAVRAAGKIRRSDVRRRRREQPGFAPAAAGAREDATWAEVRERIDAELTRLPDAYRVPLLLCYARDLSYAEAARQLGCTPGALRGRLERGRDLLRRRLERYGLPAALVIVAAGAPAVGANLRDATLSAVRAAGPGAARGAGAWVKWAGAAGLVASVLVGVGLAARLEPAASPDPNGAPRVAAPAPPEADPGPDPLPPGALARMGSSRFHHGSNIHRLAVTADGTWVISYGSHTGYRVWAVATGKEQVPVGMPADARFAQPVGQGRVVQWEALVAPAGPRVVAVVPDREEPVTRVLDVVTGREVARVPASLRHVLTRPSVSSDREPELSPDGRWMLWTHCTSDNNRPKRTVYAADLTAKTPTPAVFTEVADRTLFGSVFSGDGTSVLMNFMDAYEVWEFDTRAVKLKVPVVPNGNWVGHAVVSGDGKTLAAVHPRAATFQLWDVATRKEIPVTAEPVRGQFNVRAFSPDGKRVVTSDSAGPLRVWDAATGKKVREYPAGYGTWAAAFTPDGKRVAVARMDDVVVLDLATGTPVHDFGGHTSSVGYVGFASAGRLVTGAGGGLVWDPRTGQKLGAFEGHAGGLYGVATSPDGRVIATSGGDQKVRVRDATRPEDVRVVDTPGLVGYTLAFTPDGKELLVGGDQPGIRVLDAVGGRPPRGLAGAGPANWLGLTPDGRRVVFGRWSEKTRVHVWDRAADKEVLAFDAGKQSIQGHALSADGRLFAAGDWDGYARVYDLGTGHLVREIDTNPPGHAEYDQNTVYAVAFSPDGRTLVTGGANGTIQVWELATGAERFRLAGHRGPIMGLAFSPGGRVLASGSSDRSAVTWDVTGAGLPTAPGHRPKDAADAWARLADRDAATGFAAVRYLGARPADAVPLFAGHLRPVPAVAPDTVAGLIGKLNSPVFSEREAAGEELRRAGEGAADQLRIAIDVLDSAEVRQRLLALVAPFDGWPKTGDRLRLFRAVEAAERAGTADARKLLGVWAGGARGAALTEAARSALARLDAADSPPRP